MCSTVDLILRVYSKVEAHYQYSWGCAVLLRHISEIEVVQYDEAHYQYSRGCAVQSRHIISTIVGVQ